jgi:thiol-disulfide isomerase/thioredoxin
MMHRKFITLGIVLLAVVGAGVFGMRFLSDTANHDPDDAGMLKLFVRHPEPKPLKNFTFVDAAGKKRMLSDFSGKVVLLNLWATWCPPCRFEMPSLNRLQMQMGSDNFAVVAISLDKGGIKIPEQWLKKKELLSLEVFNDKTGKAARAVRMGGYPTSILVDRNNREIGRLTGPAEWDSKAATDLIKSVL